MAKVSLAPAIFDALVAAWRDLDGFRGPDGAGSGVTVYDGPEVLAPAGPDLDGLVVVGYGGEDLDSRANDNTPSGEAASGPVTLPVMAGYRTQEQTDEIQCVAWAWVSRVDTSAARLKVVTIVDALDTWLRDNPTAGVTSSVGVVIDVKLTAQSLTQYLHPNGGSAAMVTFTLTARTRTRS